MSVQDNIADKIPDIYFDWYARLLPGCAAVFAFLYKAEPHQIELAKENQFVAIFIAYLIGHFIQPISSFIVKRLEYCWGDEEKLENYKRSGTTKGPLEKKASKAHAEAVSMFSTSILILGIAFYYQECACPLNSYYLLLSIFLLLSAFASIHARKRKISVLTQDPS